MPYTIKKRGTGARPYKIIKTSTGEVVGSSTTRANAQKSINARNAGAHGAKLGRKRRSKR